MINRICLIAMLALLKTAIASLAAETNTASGPPATTSTNTPTKPAPVTFPVRSFHVVGNTVLPPEKLHLLDAYTGPAVDMDRLRLGLTELQSLYRSLGFATVSVTLPQQRLTNGIVEVQVVEGRLERIIVQGNRHFSTNSVLRALPSLRTNEILNTKWFQPELDQANANQDRQIYPVVSPGLAPGTSDLTLTVKDRAPWHGHFEINDRGSPNTPLLRVDLATQYNNLWQLDHQFGLEYNFSPQVYKQDNYLPNFLDQPMAASYSGFYRLPIGSAKSLREVYDPLPVDFGYDEITHQFRLPTPSGQSELIVFASRSASDTDPSYSPLTVLTNTVKTDITQQFAQRNLTFNNDVGARWTLPLRDFGGVKSSFNAGLDYKTFQSIAYNTNLTYFNLFSLDPFGNRVLVTNQTIAVGGYTSHSLYYLPLTVGWAGSRIDSAGSYSFNLNDNLYLASLVSARPGFQAVAGQSAAGGNATALSASFARDQKLPHDWSWLFRLNGQWASAPLISNEEFALGGSGGVRGYREGEAYGDSGWRALFDLRGPPLDIGKFPYNPQPVPVHLRGSWFMDFGETYPAAGSTALGTRQWGTGVGLYVNAGQYVDAHVTVAWALLNGSTSRAGDGQAYFRLGFKF